MCQALKKETKSVMKRSNRRIVEWFREAKIDRPKLHKSRMMNSMAQKQWRRSKGGSLSDCLTYFVKRDFVACFLWLWIRFLTFYLVTFGEVDMEFLVQKSSLYNFLVGLKVLRLNLEICKWVSNFMQIGALWRLNYSYPLDV